MSVFQISEKKLYRSLRAFSTASKGCVLVAFIQFSITEDLRLTAQIDFSSIKQSVFRLRVKL